MKEDVVIVDNIAHKYNDVYVLKNINFSISSNCIMGLLGSNGAGKSTMMNIICGVLKQTSGRVYIAGKDVLKEPIPAKQLLGFLPQKAPLYMDMTVKEYLRYCAELHLIAPCEISNAISRVLDICSLNQYKDRVIKQLSGGYQQRVGIAQAIIHRPKFVVLDEPTNGLDPNQILDIRKLVTVLAEETTVLISTHILSEVQAICSDIVMIEQGQVVFSGSMDEFDNVIVSDTVRVHFRNDVDANKLSILSGCESIQRLDCGEYRICFNVAFASDFTENLISFCKEQNWHLQEVVLEKKSLNDVFAYLSSQKLRV